MLSLSPSYPKCHILSIDDLDSGVSILIRDELAYENVGLYEAMKLKTKCFLTIDDLESGVSVIYEIDFTAIIAFVGESQVADEERSLAHDLHAPLEQRRLQRLHGKKERKTDRQTDRKKERMKEERMKEERKKGGRK